jgi:hypothetical protein
MARGARHSPQVSGKPRARCGRGIPGLESREARGRPPFGYRSGQAFAKSARSGAPPFYFVRVLKIKSELYSPPEKGATRRMKSLWRVFLVFIGALALLASLISCDDNPTSAPVTSTTPATTPAIMHDRPPIPAAEEAFIRAVQRGQAAFQAAPNEMAQGGTRAQRRVAICQSLNVPGQGVSVSNWVGQIDKLSSNSDGKGVLYVSLAPNIRVETWNNDFSDGSHHTLIEPSSALFAAVSQMKEGDEVAFSGNFFPSDVDCVEEHSMSLQGSMSEPEFIFRFTGVKPMN